MSSPLEKMDSVYQNIICGLPISDRILYCEQLIDKSQMSLLRNNMLLDKKIKEQLRQIIEAAQEEIKHLGTNKK